MVVYFVVGDSGSCSVALGMPSRVKIHLNLIGGHVRVVDVVRCRTESVAVWFSAHVTRRLSQTMEVSQNYTQNRNARERASPKQHTQATLGSISFIMIHVHTWRTADHTARSSSWRHIPARRG